MARRVGFTLIELVVVILILGILAAVAAPRILGMTGSATDNGLKQTLKSVRTAIELYAARNGGELPPCTGSGADFQLALEEFLRGPLPASPVGAKNSDVEPTGGTSTAADASPVCGWKFNTDTGDFICNSLEISPTDGVAYDQY